MDDYGNHIYNVWPREQLRLYFFWGLNQVGGYEKAPHNLAFGRQPMCNATMNNLPTNKWGEWWASVLYPMGTNG